MPGMERPIHLTLKHIFERKQCPSLKDLADLVEHKSLFYTVALSLAGTALITAKQRSQSVSVKKKAGKGKRSDEEGKEAKPILRRIFGFFLKKNKSKQQQQQPEEEEKKHTTNTTTTTKQNKRRAPAIDSVFVRRLCAILRIVIPRWRSKEVLLLLVQSILLVTRSMLSIQIAKLRGDALKCILDRSPKLFWMVVINFASCGVCSSIVNSGLKFLANAIATSFRLRLTRHVHRLYMSNRNYYKAAVLKSNSLDNPDQRVVEDLLKFCETASDLFSRTFKPALDVVVATIRMSHSMGYVGPLAMYGYFFAAAAVVRKISPNFPKMIAKRAQIEGDFRRAHTRIIQHSEEIAFLGGEGLERVILNERLQSVSDYSSYYFLKQFLVGIADQWIFKYFASVFGLPIVVLPFLLNNKIPTTELAPKYYEANLLIQQASSSLSELMLVYKKFQRLAGYTARVMGLIETIQQEEIDAENDAKATKEDNTSKRIGFENVSIYAPDGRLLLKDLTIDLNPGISVIITGINGAGKTSFFRVLSGLWKGRGGTILKPEGGMSVESKFSMFYMPQNPYLVTGSLRDQVTYPKRFKDKSHDAKIRKMLRKVGLGKFLSSSEASASDSSDLDYAHHDWADVLSGGEKQRVGWARLYFHQPTFAILDEATSAINPDEEGKLYEELRAMDVTFFSIAHRLELRRFHQKELNIAGDGTGAYKLTDISR